MKHYMCWDAIQVYPVSTTIFNLNIDLSIFMTTREMSSLQLSCVYSAFLIMSFWIIGFNAQTNYFIYSKILINLWVFSISDIS